MLQMRLFLRIFQTLCTVCTNVRKNAKEEMRSARSALRLSRKVRYALIKKGAFDDVFSEFWRQKIELLKVHITRVLKYRTAAVVVKVVFFGAKLFVAKVSQLHFCHFCLPLNFYNSWQAFLSCKYREVHTIIMYNRNMQKQSKKTKGVRK